MVIKIGIIFIHFHPISPKPIRAFGTMLFMDGSLGFVDNMILENYAIH